MFKPPLEFQDLYKFWASLGITLIAGSCIGSWFYMKEPIPSFFPTYSKELASGFQIHYKHWFSIGLFYGSPLILISTFFLGFILIFHGLRKWKPRQERIDQREEQEFREHLEQAGISKDRRELMAITEILESKRVNLNSSNDAGTPPAPLTTRPNEGVVNFSFGANTNLNWSGTQSKENPNDNTAELDQLKDRIENLRNTLIQAEKSIRESFDKKLFEIDKHYRNKAHSFNARISSLERQSSSENATSKSNSTTPISLDQIVALRKEIEQQENHLAQQIAEIKSNSSQIEQKVYVEFTSYKKEIANQILKIFNAIREDSVADKPKQGFGMNATSEPPSRVHEDQSTSHNNSIYLLEKFIEHIGHLLSRTYVSYPFREIDSIVYDLVLLPRFQARGDILVDVKFFEKELTKENIFAVCIKSTEASLRYQDKHNRTTRTRLIVTGNFATLGKKVVAHMEKNLSKLISRKYKTQFSLMLLEFHEIHDISDSDLAHFIKHGHT